MIITTDENHIWELIEKARLGNTVKMIGIGKSMSPLLIDSRDYIYLIAVNNDTRLNKNDIIFYKSHEDKYVLHRIYSISEAGYYPNGDGNLSLEPLLQRDRIYLKAVGFERKGRYIPVESKWYQCYVRVWTKLLPIRGHLLRCCRGLCKVISIVKRGKK